LPVGAASFQTAQSHAPAPFGQVEDLLHWQVTINVPQSYFKTRKAECARVRQLVTSLLPTNATISNVAVVPHSETPPSAESNAGVLIWSAPMSAWPHVACVLLGVLVVATVWRSRRRAAPPFARSTMDSIADKTEPTSGTTKLKMGGTGSDAGQVLNLPVSQRQVENAPHEGSIDPPILNSTVPDHARSDPLILLQQTDPRRLADALQHERPQAVAVLLTRFSTRLASETLARLPSALQLDVIRRLKSLGEVPTDLVHEIARTVNDRLQATSIPTRNAAPAVNPPAPTNRLTHLLKPSPKQKSFT